MPKKPEYEDVIKDHATALVAGMLAESDALKSIEHSGHKGTCRELLLADLLQHFLPSYLSLSTGVIVNPFGESVKERQSNQVDIIIYDNRIIPPFLKKHDTGLVPIEAVIAVIEVKTMLNEREIYNEKVNKQTGEKRAVGIVPAANRLMRAIPLTVLRLAQDRFWRELDKSKEIMEELMSVFTPYMAVFAYDMEGLEELKYQGRSVMTWGTEITEWCDQTFVAISYVCVAKKVSCIRFGNGWRPNGPDHKTHEEVKRFIAVLIDNCRRLAHKRFMLLSGTHFDGLSAYVRHQGS